MKKQLYLLAGVAAILASCSKTETVEQAPSRTIDFAASWVGNSVDSKATVSEVNKGNLDKFYVFAGYKDNMTHVFENAEISKSDGQWTYQPPVRYWAPGESYKFAAYAPEIAGGAGSVTADLTSGHLTITDYVASPDIQNDLIYAEYAVESSQINESYAEPVKFNFSHILSMVKVTFKSKFAAGITVKISDFKLYNVASKGTFNGTAWSGQSELVAEGAPFTATINDIKNTQIQPGGMGDASSETPDFAVIPQNAGTNNVTVSFKVQVLNEAGLQVGADKTLTAKITTDWAQGNRYNYTIVLEGDDTGLKPIVFGAPEVSGIGDGGTSEIQAQ
ncbi:fimbrillin family protein [Millionella massiliensis]|uniref:fimbrillin family protein n=1 Tax=Millionella massiliensis TaxID=1871023 RepID=UPI001356404A|nr:fimbrillin family protein [Millionella massiliensis]